jgi:hypothetical protein
MSILNAITSGAGGVALSGDTSGNLTIQSAGTNVATFTTGGNLNFAVSNAGINFNNSGAVGASTLNDYETGTWTPTDVSGAGLTFPNASGYYIKIGKQVTAWAQVTYPTTASALVARVGSYPFTTANTDSARSGGMLGYKTITTVFSVLIQSGNTVMDFRDSTGNSVTNASISGGNFYFAFTYYTA